MPDSAAQTKEEALDVLLLAVRRFLYPRPTPDAAELQAADAWVDAHLGTRT